VFVGVTPLGSIIVGTIAEWFGVAAAYALAGVAALTFIVVLGLVWRRAQA
jgi:hypothetical protein